MLNATIEVIKTLLKTDETLTPADRTRIIIYLRTGKPSEGKAAEAAPPQILSRKEVAQRLGRSLGTVDGLARSGVLPRRTLPGRKRAVGFYASDVDALFPLAA
jgi:predicted DNA-binding transcriptional regulator AlpA